MTSVMKRESSRSYGEERDGGGDAMGRAEGAARPGYQESSLFGGGFGSEREVKKVDETLLADGMVSTGAEGDEKEAVGKGDLAKGDQDVGRRVGQGGKTQGADKLALRAALEGEYRETQRKRQ